MVMPEFGLAGAERMCETLVLGLKKSQNYEVIVASLYNFHSSITDELEKNGVKLYYIGKGNGVDFRVIKRLATIMKMEKIDIVHTHRYVMQYAIPAAVLTNVKIRIHTIHNVADKEVDSFRQKLACFFYKYCSVIPVSISPIVQSTVIKRYSLEPNQTPVIFNGVDLSKCMPKMTYHNNGIFQFVHIGRFCTQKNHASILGAAAKLKREGYQFEILLIGGAGNEEKRQNEAREMELDRIIKFCGIQSNIYPYLNKADCFILPSFYEGMPVTLVEAMGTGLPIIASRVGGIPDMIKDKYSGLLIEPNSNDLANAMKLMMDNKELRVCLGMNALKDSERFSSIQMTEGYSKLYEKAYGKKSKN